MDKKVYERTRYQNIYRHKKNKNYVIMISKPVKTSISKIDDKKIYDINLAIKVRDNVKLRNTIKTNIKESFETIWEKYIYQCTDIKKLSYSSIVKKNKIYNRYLKNINIKISKIDKKFLTNFINKLNCSYKQKNEIMKQLRCFFNWCCEEDFLIINPMNKIKDFKVPKTEMKYWSPSELKQFIDTLDKDIESNILSLKKKALLVKTLTLIGFSLGDRIGETRALTFNSLNVNNETITINHSINYDRKSKDYLSNTKTYHSQRTVDITPKLIDIINTYRRFLECELELPVKDFYPIFFNYDTMMPFTDGTLRNHFYFYCDKANVKRIRMYDLRHTYVATMMAENKELYNISERIGHSNFNTTINKYGHLSNEVRKEIAKTTDKYF